MMRNSHPLSSSADLHHAAWTSTSVNEPSSAGLTLFLSPRCLVLLLVNATSWIKVLSDSRNKRTNLHSSLVWRPASAQELADWLGPHYGEGNKCQLSAITAGAALALTAGPDSFTFFSHSHSDTAGGCRCLFFSNKLARYRCEFWSYFGNVNNTEC